MQRFKFNANALTQRMNDISDNDIRSKVQNLLEYQDVEFDNNEINKLIKYLGNDNVKRVIYKNHYLTSLDAEQMPRHIVDFRDTLRRICFFDDSENFKRLYGEFDEGILYIIEEK